MNRMTLFVMSGLLLLCKGGFAQRALLPHQAAVCDAACGTTERIILNVHAGVLYFDARAGRELVLTVYTARGDVLEAVMPFRQDLCVRWIGETFSGLSGDAYCDNHAVFSGERTNPVCTNDIAQAVDPLWLDLNNVAGELTLAWNVVDSPVRIRNAVITPHCDVHVPSDQTCDCSTYFTAAGITPTTQEVVLACYAPLAEPPLLTFPPPG